MNGINGNVIEVCDSREGFAMVVVLLWGKKEETPPGGGGGGWA